MDGLRYISLRSFICKRRWPGENGRILFLFFPNSPWQLAWICMFGMAAFLKWFERIAFSCACKLTNLEAKSGTPCRLRMAANHQAGQPLLCPEVSYLTILWDIFRWACPYACFGCACPRLYWLSLHFSRMRKSQPWWDKGCLLSSRFLC